MIKSIHIKNYRSLRDVNVEPGLINVFVGPNASGKSNFLDALRFLTHMANVGLVKTFADRGGFAEVFWKGETTETSIEFDIQFEMPLPEGQARTGGRYVLIIEGSQRGLITVKRESLLLKQDAGGFVNIIDMQSGHGTAKHLDGSKAFDSPGNPAGSVLEFNVPNWIGTSFKTLVAQWHFYTLIPLAMKQIKPFTRANFLTEHGDNLIEFLTTLKTAHSESFRQIEQVVKDTFPGLEALAPEPNQAGQVFLRSRERFLKTPVSVWNMAEGELAFIAFAALILSPPEAGSMLTCVEEPENHLHPRLLETLIELLRQTESRLIAEGQGPSQVFVTTHSPYVVDRLKLDELIVVEKTKGETHYSRPQDKAELRALISREEQGLGELWFSGALGGV
jgi:predicted ATPase